jgi:hypothetical protein
LPLRPVFFRTVLKIYILCSVSLSFLFVSAETG